MTLKYSLSIDDILAFNRFALGRILWWISAPATVLIFSVPTLSFLSGAGNLNSLIGSYIFDTITLAGIGLGFFYPRQTAVLYSFLMVGLVAYCYFLNILTALAVFLPLMIAAGYSGFFVEQLLRYLYSGKHGMIGSRTLEIDHEGVHERTEYEKSMHQWELIGEIKQDQRYVYIFVGKLRAYIVPKSYFTSPEEVDKFYKYLMSLKDANIVAAVSTK